METDRDQFINNHEEFVLPDLEGIENEWGSLEDNFLDEEPVVDNEDPFATMPINSEDGNENFTLEDIISQILDFNDPLITTPMEIEENGIQIVAIYGAFQDGPDPPSEQSSDEE